MDGAPGIVGFTGDGLKRDEAFGSALDGWLGERVGPQGWRAAVGIVGSWPTAKTKRTGGCNGCCPDCEGTPQNVSLVHRGGGITRLMEQEGEKHRILIVDDHPLLRHGLQQVLNAEEDLVVCAEAGDAGSALESLRHSKPDLALVDISLAGMNGIELIKYMKAESEQVPILVLSMHDESLYAMRALRAGASGYVMKVAAISQMVEAIRKVLKGEIYVSQVFGAQLIYKTVRGIGGDSPIEGLSDRELEVLQLIGRGRGSREIAGQLHLSVKTIESHRLHIKEKLGLETASELVRFAVEWVNEQGGLQEPPPQDNGG